MQDSMCDKIRRKSYSSGEQITRTKCFYCATWNVCKIGLTWEACVSVCC